MIGSITSNSYQSSSAVQWNQRQYGMSNQNRGGFNSNMEVQNSSDLQSSMMNALFSQDGSDNTSALTQQGFASALSQMFQRMMGGSSVSTSGAGAPPPPPPGDSEEMFNTLDTDSDGYLTVDELTAGNVPDAEKIFSEIDTDGDEKISQAESDAFEEKMKANGPQSATADSSTESSTENESTLQMEFLKKLMEMISQYQGYSQNGSSAGTSIFA